MSKESAIKFLRELKTNEKAKELLQGRERPKNKEDAIKAYAEVAKELGEDISAEDIAQALEEIEAEIHQKTEAVSVDKVEVNNGDVEVVACGKDHPECENTVDYSDWCGLNDWCVNFDNQYECEYDWER